MRPAAVCGLACGLSRRSGRSIAGAAFLALCGLPWPVLCMVQGLRPAAGSPADLDGAGGYASGDGAGVRAKNTAKYKKTPFEVLHLHLLFLDFA